MVNATTAARYAERRPPQTHPLRVDLISHDLIDHDLACAGCSVRYVRPRRGLWRLRTTNCLCRATAATRAARTAAEPCTPERSPAARLVVREHLRALCQGSAAAAVQGGDQRPCRSRRARVHGCRADRTGRSSRWGAQRRQHRRQRGGRRRGRRRAGSDALFSRYRGRRGGRGRHRRPLTSRWRRR